MEQSGQGCILSVRIFESEANSATVRNELSQAHRSRIRSLALSMLALFGAAMLSGCLESEAE